jgi:Amt family ammonium transporter
VHTDPTRLRQVLINLVSNAIKFTASGHVELRIKLLNERSDDPHMLFEVHDTGIGLTPDQLARIFQPFIQATPYTEREYGGTGLGLVISQQIARMLGGDIVASSNSGQGSLFRLTIAVGSLEGVRLLTDVREEAFVETWRPPLPIQPILDCRVLLAEDGVDNQRLIGHVLDRAGAQVVVADNGESAVELALAAWNENRPFDVILMDLFMPVMDGYTATERLRKAGYEHPIVALTANAVAADLQRCFDAGCDDFATKPIDRKGLVDLVARFAQNAACVVARE